jgi:hypothetical protein
MASEIKVDTISEKTSANGVSIDSVVHKDSAVYPSSADGGALGSASNEWSDLFLADSSVIKFGADQDTTLTHTDGTGLTLNSTNKLCFNDASQFVQGSSATVLSIGATDEIDLTATAIDINGTCDISGTFSLGGTNITTTAAEINLIDGGTSRGTTALADGDGILINDAGTMRMTNVTAVKTYMATAALAGIDDQSSSNDDQLTITDSTVVINEDGDNVDFRVESDTKSHCLFVDASGNSSAGFVSINTDSNFDVNNIVPSVGLTINAGNYGAATASASADELVITNAGSAGMSILTNNDQTGSIYFGDQNDFDVGQIVYDHTSNFMQFTINATEHFRIASDGTLTATDTSIGSNSDSRVKKNIADFTYDVAKFKQLQPRTFDWKNPSQHNGVGGNRGFIAQEVQAIDDYWVGEFELNNNHADYSLLDSVTINNCVIDNERIIASGISESDWETGKLNDTYPKDSTWKASAEGDRVSLTSKLGKKDAMYISIIQQLITRIEALEG